jgi:hypothetical protein
VGAACKRRHSLLDLKTLCAAVMTACAVQDGRPPLERTLYSFGSQKDVALWKARAQRAG